MTSNLDHLSPVWTHMTQIQPVRGEGIYLYDADGKRYTDFTSGIGVTSTGHCHPSVVQAVKDQAEKLLFGQMNIVIPPVAIELAEELTKVFPPELETFFFSNSGAEAVEASVKLARQATSKQNIIVLINENITVFVIEHISQVLPVSRRKLGSKLKWSFSKSYRCSHIRYKIKSIKYSHMMRIALFINTFNYY